MQTISPLALYPFPSISNLSPLNNKNITTLQVNNNQIFDISVIWNFSSLSNITLWHNCLDWTGLDTTIQSKLNNINAWLWSTNYGEQYLCRSNVIEYSPSNDTSWDVISNISIYWDQTKKAALNESDWKYIFIENWTHIFNLDFPWDFIDEKDGNVTASVTWIDKTNPTCNINYSTTDLTSGNVVASLTWCNETITMANNSWNKYYTFTWNWIFIFTFVDHVWNPWFATWEVAWIDKTPPVFNFNNNSGYECTTGILRVNNLNDNVELATNPIKFNWGERDILNTFDILPQKWSQIQTISGYVMDKAWNISMETATYTFLDTWITAQDFSVDNVWSGTTTNWLTSSQATEWDCGNKYISAIIKTQWNSGNCILSGKNIIYTPDENIIWSDTCTITLQDLEWNGTDVVINWNDINSLWDLKYTIDYTPISWNWTSGNVKSKITFILFYSTPS